MGDLDSTDLRAARSKPEPGPARPTATETLARARRQPRGPYSDGSTTDERPSRIVASETPALGWLTLLASSGTLVCCALPIALVTLGFGAAVAALTSAFPLLVTLSDHKGWVFGVSAVLMLATARVLWRPGRACPTDPNVAARCERATRWNRRLLVSSGVVWALGFFAAYLALPIRIWLGV